MAFALRQEGRNLIVSFEGGVNLEGDVSASFKERLKTLIDDGADRVVVDLGNVGFMDSQGLGALISCLKALKQGEGRIVLANLSAPVDSVLRVTRLRRVFDVRPTVAEGLAFLDAPPVDAEQGAAAR
jgi:anti-sigma B factor antagonist